jgi:hypothetical protein
MSPSLVFVMVSMEAGRIVYSQKHNCLLLVARLAVAAFDERGPLWKHFPPNVAHIVAPLSGRRSAP